MKKLLLSALLGLVAGHAIAQSAPGTVTVAFAQSPYAIQTSDRFIICDASAGPVVLNLPTATGSGQELIVKEISDAGNGCTVNTTGIDKIDGATVRHLNFKFATYAAKDVLANQWYGTQISMMFGDVVGVTVNNKLAVK